MHNVLIQHCPPTAPCCPIANLQLSSNYRFTLWLQALSFIDYVSQIKGAAFISTRMCPTLCVHMEAFAGQMGYFPSSKDPTGQKRDSQGLGK